MVALHQDLQRHSFCNAFAGIKRNDATTWDDARWPPKFFDSGIINRLEVYLQFITPVHSQRQLLFVHR